MLVHGTIEVHYNLYILDLGSTQPSPFKAHLWKTYFLKIINNVKMVTYWLVPLMQSLDSSPRIDWLRKRFPIYRVPGWQVITKSVSVFRELSRVVVDQRRSCVSLRSLTRSGQSLSRWGFRSFLYVSLY